MHRLLVVSSEEALWETPRQDVVKTEIKQFSLGRRDLRITFQYGSQIRLTAVRRPIPPNWFDCYRADHSPPQRPHPLPHGRAPQSSASTDH